MDKLFDGFFIGINYWASKNATKMWQDFDEESIENDLALLESVGVSVLRIFPRWDDFQPITAYSAPGGIFDYGMRDEPRPDTEAGGAGVDEIMCERFERFCALAASHGMKLIVGLLTGHMSFGNFIPPALVNRKVVTDPVCHRWELRYIKYLVRRFSSIENIAAWDLGNEINMLAGGHTKDEFHAWCVMLSDAIRVSDPTRPILSGVGGFSIENKTCNLYDLAESCDINTIHAYNIFDTATEPINTMKPILDNIFKCRVSEDLTDMPSFVQEFGAIGYTNCSLKSEMEFYRATTLAAMANGTCGVMYWCAFDQGHLTFPPYNWNNIGSEYGFFDKNGKAKPLALENKRLSKFARDFGGKLRMPKTNCTIMIPREEQEDSREQVRAAYLLAKRAGLEPDFCYATRSIPHSELYIFPSVKFNKAITNTNLEKVMERVREGATLYISLSKAYFRNVPFMAGVTVENMTVGAENREMIFEDGESMPIVSVANYEIIPEACEVLASDHRGNPLFVKNACGKGEIYFLFAPLEEYLAGKKGAFYDPNTPDYERIYRTVSQRLDKKMATTDSKFIDITVHEDEDGYYLFALNYSRYEQSATLTVDGNYRLTALWGNSLDGKRLTLAPCDGILIRAEKV